MALNRRATGIIIPLQVECWAHTYNIIYNWFVGPTFTYDSLHFQWLQWMEGPYIYPLIRFRPSYFQLVQFLFVE